MARLRLLLLLLWCLVGWTLSAPTAPSMETTTAAIEVALEGAFSDQVAPVATPEGVARALAEAEPAEETAPSAAKRVGNTKLRRHTIPPTRAGPSVHDRRTAAAGHPAPRRSAPRRDPAERAPPVQS